MCSCLRCASPGESTRTFVCACGGRLIDLDGNLFGCEGCGEKLEFEKEAREVESRRDFEKMDGTHYLVMERLERKID